MKERARFEQEIADLESESSDSHPLPAKGPGSGTAKVKKRILLVAGFDYEDPSHLMNSYCHNRIKRILRKKRGSESDPALSFTLFDVGAGKIRTFDVSGKKRVWADQTTFTPVTAADNYTGRTFNRNQSGRMSITDIYDFVRKQGRSEPGTVHELSFFAHGWAGGPLLVNSFDNLPADTRRDPDDKDGRALKDFTEPNMDATGRSELAAAFAPAGFTWLWGCVFAAPPFQVLHRLLRDKLYKSGKLKNDDLIELRYFTREHADKFFASDTIFFPERRGDGTYALSFYRSFLEIKEFFQRMIDLSYCKRIAKATGRKCYGALPGTYSEYDKKTSFLPLMLVPRSSAYSANFSGQVNFYKRHMGITLDPEGRGYGTHVP